ncbi:MAG: hypothetical protein KBC07_02770 [Bacteroidales bacterium]|jgi:hypothetical protein|nr:hypothetical protein [Bacteroidales bacterium]
MSDYEMRNFGFVTLDASVQCVITGGDSEYGVLGDIIQDLLNGLASKMGKAGFLVAMLAKNIDSFIDGFRDGWNK